jgi:hypothetical protein
MRIFVAGFCAGGLCVALAAIDVNCFPQATPMQQEEAAAQLAACVSANWGKDPIVIAAACTSGAVTVAEDIIADIEAAVEVSAGQIDGGTGVVMAAFPYKDNAEIMSKIQTAKTKILFGKAK